MSESGSNYITIHETKEKVLSIFPELKNELICIGYYSETIIGENKTTISSETHRSTIENLVVNFSKKNKIRISFDGYFLATENVIRIFNEPNENILLMVEYSEMPMKEDEKNSELFRKFVQMYFPNIFIEEKRDENEEVIVLNYSAFGVMKKGEEYIYSEKKMKLSEYKKEKADKLEKENQEMIAHNLLVDKKYKENASEDSEESDW